MIKEKTSHTSEGQRITYGIIDDKEFRLEINELNLMYGTVSTLRIAEHYAKTDDTTSVITSNIPDEYKLNVADINKKYGTRFLVESQITKGWGETK